MEYLEQKNRQARSGATGGDRPRQEVTRGERRRALHRAPGGLSAGPGRHLVGAAGGGKGSVAANSSRPYFWESTLRGALFLAVAADALWSGCRRR